MGKFSEYLEDNILNEVFGGATFSAPGTLYIGVSTTTIQEDGSGITEPVGNGYTRVAVANNATNFPATSTQTKSNGTSITFPDATGTWGTITDMFISDSASGGNMIGFDAIDTPRLVQNGDTLNFRVGAITITMN